VLAGLAVAMIVAGTGCSGDDDTATATPEVERWVYQLQGYADDGVDELVAAPGDLAVIDLARDGDWFSAEEVGELQDSGKIVLAYLSIGTIENFRPELADLPGEVILNVWPDWPEEHWVRYWHSAWWDEVVRPRVDQALAAGFDGVYLDTPLAYENIDLSLLAGEGEDRDTLAQKMVDLIVRISEHGKAQDPGFLVFPRTHPSCVTTRATSTPSMASAWRSCSSPPTTTPVTSPASRTGAPRT
jgi:cysteinyl-tRNA synthetase